MTRKHLLAIAVASAAVVGLAGPASANSPMGVWIDHTGRGGVEITECGPNLCGRLVWLKDSRNKGACGTQILGNVKPMGPGVWDKGWIYDPEERSRYDVELKPISPDRLRVVGYMGSKFLSETMIWKRAPGDLQRCGVAEPAKAAKAAPVEPPARPPAVAGEATPAPVAKAPVEAPPATKPAEAKPVEAKSAEAKPAPVERAEAPPVADEPGSKPRKTNRQRTAKRECRLDLPYIKVTYPCID